MRKLRIYEKQKVITNKLDFKTKINNKQSLMFYFKNVITKKERNIAIKNAYNANYSQVEISNYTKLSESSISKIVNS